MVLYIHGFASCGAGNKVETLQRAFGKDTVYAPDLPVAPNEALIFLRDWLKNNPTELLVGSSLGGFYADCLNAEFLIPSVLINPSTRPFETLQRCLGTNTNWCSGEPFEWRSEYLDQLSAEYRSKPELNERYLVLLQTKDEVLDYRLAEERYRHHQVVVEQGGNHRFENLDDYIGMIKAFTA